MVFRKSVRSKYRRRVNPTLLSTRKRPPLRVIFLSKTSAKPLTAAEERKCNNLLYDCFENAEVGRLTESTCIIGMLAKQVVAFICISEMRQTPQSPASPQLLVHTVCTSARYRGRGLMRQMFRYMANMPEFANRSFQLSASNLVERNAGLNQITRFKIYSKVGFTIPVGTEIHPSGEIVKDVFIDPSNREILYHLAPSSGSGTIVQHRSGDMAIDSCYMNGEPQERGCIMQASVDVVKAFTDRDTG